MTADRDDSDELSRAQALIDIGRHDAAAAVIAQVLAREPDSFRGHCLMALVEREREDYRAMLRSADAAVAARPAYEWGHRLRAIALRGLGRLDAAVAAAEESVRLAPHTYQAFITLAHCHLAFESVVAAQRAYLAARKAVELAPEESNTHVTLGQAHAAAGDSPKAQACYERALALDPMNSVARNNLAVEQLRTGRYTAAGRHLIDALAQNPHDAVIQRNLASSVSAWLLRRADIATLLWLGGMATGLFHDPLILRVACGLLAVVLVGSVVVEYRRLPSVARRLVRARPVRGELGRITAWICTLLPLASLLMRAVGGLDPWTAMVNGFATFAVFVTFFRAYARTVEAAERLQKRWGHRLFLRRIDRPSGGRPDTSRIRHGLGLLRMGLIRWPVGGTLVAVAIIASVIAHARIFRSESSDPSNPFKVGQCLSSGTTTFANPAQIVHCEENGAVYRIVSISPMASPGEDDPCASLPASTELIALTSGSTKILCLTEVRHLPTLTGLGRFTPRAA